MYTIECSVNSTSHVLTVLKVLYLYSGTLLVHLVIRTIRCIVLACGTYCKDAKLSLRTKLPWLFLSAALKLESQWDVASLHIVVSLTLNQGCCLLALPLLFNVATFSENGHCNHRGYASE
jgi:hypothetical protein